MYRLGHRPKNKRKRVLVASSGLLMMVILVTLGSYFIRALLKPTTQLNQSAAVVTSVTTPSTATHIYDEGDYTISLPGSWKPATRETQPYNIYRWQDATQSTNSRILEVYEDTIPHNFAVNRVLAVSANDDQLSIVGGVSDNCVDFTKSDGSTSSTGAHAKWQGLDFLCDLNNYERNVVGSTSSEGINIVTLKGAKSGSHEFFFTYTDHNINPDYTTFYNALNTFRMK